jgi:hypothetical protein
LWAFTRRPLVRTRPAFTHAARASITAQLTCKAALDKVSNERRLNSGLVSRSRGELSIDLTLDRTDTMRVVQNGSGCGSHERIERANSVSLEQSTQKMKIEEARFNLDWVFGRDA